MNEFFLIKTPSSPLFFGFVSANFEENNGTQKMLVIFCQKFINLFSTVKISVRIFLYLKNWFSKIFLSKWTSSPRVPCGGACLGHLAPGQVVGWGPAEEGEELRCIHTQPFVTGWSRAYRGYHCFWTKFTLITLGTGRQRQTIRSILNLFSWLCCDKLPS